jgi:7-carboxy-7-deazaguanine synthase
VGDGNGRGNVQAIKLSALCGQIAMFITEIFKSIQGEGTRAGLPCIFVRLTGCNLRCVWCDTAYAFYGGEKHSLDDVLAKVEKLANVAAGRNERRVRLVEITGGEPLLQPETPELASRLLRENYTVMIETSGERFVGALPREVIKIVDVKCPDSREGGKFDVANLDAIDAKDEVKFVIASRRDYEFAKEFSAEYGLANRVAQVLFSPVFPDPAGQWTGLSARELTEWILEDGLPVRLGLQLHKFVWDPATKGV